MPNILCKKYFNRKSVEVQRWTPLEVIQNEFYLWITVCCMQRSRKSVLPHWIWLYLPPLKGPYILHYAIKGPQFNHHIVKELPISHRVIEGARFFQLSSRGPKFPHCVIKGTQFIHCVIKGMHHNWIICECTELQYKNAILSVCVGG